MMGYAIYELTPAPWGDDYRFIVLRDRREDAEKVLSILNETDISFSVYRIVECKRSVEEAVTGHGESI